VSGKLQSHPDRPDVLELEGCLLADELAFVPRFPMYRIANNLFHDGLLFLEEGASVCTRAEGTEHARGDTQRRFGRPGKQYIFTANGQGQTKSGREPLAFRTSLDLKTRMLDAGGERYRLSPGMQVSAEINVGTLTVMEYLL
jgi:hypothetical protein